MVTSKWRGKYKVPIMRPLQSIANFSLRSFGTKGPDGKKKMIESRFFFPLFRKQQVVYAANVYLWLEFPERHPSFKRGEKQKVFFKMEKKSIFFKRLRFHCTSKYEAKSVSTFLFSLCSLFTFGVFTTARYEGRLETRANQTNFSFFLTSQLQWTLDI